jgi:hypothetical protein
MATSNEFVERLFFAADVAVEVPVDDASAT